MGVLADMGDDFPATREYMRTRNALVKWVVEVESLKGKWVGVISYEGTGGAAVEAKEHAKDMARTLNLVTQSKGDTKWARVRKAKS